MKKQFEVVVAEEECKGCRRCVNACPRKVLEMGSRLSRMGFPAAEAVRSEACVGCGICFYTCPEPGAITVFRLEEEKNVEESQK